MVKKIILGVVAVLALAVIGLLVGASMQPDTFRVERSLEMNAPANVIYTQVADLQKWGEWSPWEKLDPNMSKTFEGEPGTVGSSYSWSGNDDVGSGTMSISELTPDKNVSMDLMFKTPMESSATTAVDLEAKGNSTNVTWSMEGNNEGLVAKMFYMFMDFDAMIGKDYDEGLGMLKTATEKIAAKKAAEAEVVAETEEGGENGTKADEAGEG